MMELPDVAELRWANAEQTAIDCTITIGNVALPFSASAEDPEELGRAIFAAATAGEFGAIAAYEAPPEPEPVVPSVVSPRQLRLALLAAGKLDAIDAFVSGGGVSEAARISWEYATEYRRDDALLNAMAEQLQPPLTEADIDRLFIAAAAIP